MTAVALWYVVFRKATIVRYDPGPQCRREHTEDDQVPPERPAALPVRVNDIGERLRRKVASAVHVTKRPATKDLRAEARGWC